jgi:hypothetical protein
MPLQLLQRTRQRRLRQVQLLGRPRERALLGDREQHPQMAFSRTHAPSL